MRCQNSHQPSLRESHKVRCLKAGGTSATQSRPKETGGHAESEQTTIELVDGERVSESSTPALASAIN